MLVFEHSDPDSLAVRSHPWSGSLSDAAHQYVDFRREPALIRSVLEDFRGWEQYPAIETFYQLLEWLNGPESALETNDCAFNGPAADGKPKTVECSGRLMVLFRDWPLNTAVRVRAFTEVLARALAGEDEGFESGGVGATLVPVRFTALGPDGQLGSQLMLSFWAWGEDEGETMAHLDRTLADMARVLRSVGR